MKKIILITLGLGISLGLFFVTYLDSPVVFQSLESKTKNGDPVFNRIQAFFAWNKDIWVMQQSHNGLHKNFSIWDRLAIVVDKTKRPYQAKFYQLKPGELKFNGQNEATAYKVRCYACHSNGPRAIRPDFISQQLKLGIKDRLQLQLWNIRIKTYGNVQSVAGKEFAEEVPFKSNLKLLSQSLDLKSCNKCHSTNGIRAPLKLEHVGTAEFLVKRGQMPPFPFKISKTDAKKLEYYMK